MSSPSKPLAPTGPDTTPRNSSLCTHNATRSVWRKIPVSPIHWIIGPRHRLIKSATTRPALLACDLSAATARGVGLLAPRSARLTAHEDEHEHQGEHGIDNRRREPPEKAA